MRRGFVTKRRAWGWLGTVLLALATIPDAARAQETIAPPRVALVAGAFVHDLGEGGTATILGIRLGLPLLSHLSVEPGLAYTKYRGEPPTGGGEASDVPLLMGDLQVQGRYPLERFTPYLGMGIGTALNLSEDRAQTDDFVTLTYTGSAGVRAGLVGSLEAIAEVRLRGIDALERDATELVLGLALPF
jgi:hypothetical protein